MLIIIQKHQEVYDDTIDIMAHDVEIIISLKYFNNFWRTLEMLSVSCEISLMLTWSKKLFLSCWNC